MYYEDMDQELTCLSDRGLKTSPTVFCKSPEPKPKRGNRDAPPEPDDLPCALDEVASVDESP